MMTLSKALKSGRLREFIEQEEARGVGPANSKQVETAIKALAATLPQSEDQTSRSSSGDGSNGT
jgi:hypothetical protein